MKVLVHTVGVNTENAASALPAAQEWKQGLPAGPYYEGMTKDFEVYFSPGGFRWHRRRNTSGQGG